MKPRLHLILFGATLILLGGVFRVEAQLPVTDAGAISQLGTISSTLSNISNTASQTQQNTADTKTYIKDIQEAQVAAGELSKQLAQAPELQALADAVSKSDKINDHMGIKIDPKTGLPSGGIAQIEAAMTPSGQMVGAFTKVSPPVIFPLRADQATELLKYSKEYLATAQGQQAKAMTLNSMMLRYNVKSADPKDYQNDVKKLRDGLNKLLSGELSTDYGLVDRNVVVRKFVPMDNLYVKSMFREPAGMGRMMFWTNAQKKMYEPFAGNLDTLGSMLGVNVSSSMDMSNIASNGYKDLVDKHAKETGGKNPYENYADAVVPGLAVMHASGQLSGGILTNDQIQKAMQLTAQSKQESEAPAESIFKGMELTEQEKKAAETAKALKETLQGQKEGFGTSSTSTVPEDSAQYVMVIGPDPLKEASNRMAIDSQLGQMRKLRAQDAIAKSSIAYNKGVLEKTLALNEALSKVEISEKAAAGGAGSNIAAMKVSAINATKSLQKQIEALGQREKQLDIAQAKLASQLEGMAEKSKADLAADAPSRAAAVLGLAGARAQTDAQMKYNEDLQKAKQADPMGTNRPIGGSVGSSYQSGSGSVGSDYTSGSGEDFGGNKSEVEGKIGD